MQNNITIGSVVQLKSGSPKMTVVDIFSGFTRDNKDIQMASCAHYTGVVKFTDLYPVESLEIIK